MTHHRALLQPPVIGRWGLTSRAAPGAVRRRHVMGGAAGRACAVAGEGLGAGRREWVLQFASKPIVNLARMLPRPGGGGSVERARPAEAELEEGPGCEWGQGWQQRRCYPCGITEHSHRII